MAYFQYGDPRSAGAGALIELPAIYWAALAFYRLRDVRNSSNQVHRESDREPPSPATQVTRSDAAEASTMSRSWISRFLYLHGALTLLVGVAAILVGIAESIDSPKPDEAILVLLWISGLALLICGAGLLQMRLYGLKAMFFLTSLTVAMPLFGSLKSQGAFVWHIAALLFWGLPAIAYYKSRRQLFR